MSSQLNRDSAAIREINRTLNKEDAAKEKEKNNSLTPDNDKPTLEPDTTLVELSQSDGVLK